MSEELKPCQYCGGKAEIEYDYDGNEYESWEWYDLVFDHADNCIYGYQNASFNTKEELIEACNKREPNPEIKDVYEKYYGNVIFEKGKIIFSEPMPISAIGDLMYDCRNAIKKAMEE